MSCLICKNFRAIEPEDHKRLREAGRCEGNCGAKWDHYTAVRYLQHHGTVVDGWCLLNPEPKHVSGRHVCAQIAVPEYYFNGHWSVERRLDGDSAHLHEWAEKQIQNLTSKEWGAQRREWLEEQNKELRRQLQRARAISRQRLERLQKGEAVAEKPKPIAGKIVRLVAAE